MKRALLLLPVLLLSALVVQQELDEPALSSADEDVIPGRYIVLLEPGADPGRAARSLGVDVRAVYRRAVTGFSAEMSAARAAQIAESPSVSLVEPVRRVRIALHENSFQTLTEGADRIDLEESASAGVGLPAGPDVDADIAIIDTGIDLDHPDLNAMPGFAAYEARIQETPPLYGGCNSANDPDDEHGHGTHVAGTAGAIDNEIGVVGTAPGARLWSVRVLRDDGFGCDDDVLLGVDWVTDRKMEFDDGPGDGDPGINFTVANMSLGGDPSPALCAGIANSVAQGVIYAAAAGNDLADASVSSPGNCPDVVTVSAFADYDGLAGGLAGQTCSWTEITEPDPDDSFAWFSNYGPLVEIAAPGVCVMSTFVGGLYAALRGTSMATPHVAGAIALFRATTGYGGPYDGASVMAALTAASLTRPQSSACGFTDDPDSSPEPVLYMGTSCLAATSTPSPSPSPSPSPTPTSTPSPTVTPTASPAPTATPTESPSPTPTASPSPSPSPEPLDSADINCDHAVTGSDSLILIRFAAAIDTPLPPGCPPVGALSAPGPAAVPAQLRGDLNCSGAVDVADALVILRILAGLTGPVETPCAS